MNSAWILSWPSRKRICRFLCTGFHGPWIPKSTAGWFGWLKRSSLETKGGNVFSLEMQRAKTVRNEHDNPTLWNQRSKVIWDLSKSELAGTFFFSTPPSLFDIWTKKKLHINILASLLTGYQHSPMVALRAAGKIARLQVASPFGVLVDPTAKGCFLDHLFMGKLEKRIYQSL